MCHCYKLNLQKMSAKDHDFNDLSIEVMKKYQDIGYAAVIIAVDKQADVKLTTRLNEKAVIKILKDCEAQIRGNFEVISD